MNIAWLPNQQKPCGKKGGLKKVPVCEKKSYCQIFFFKLKREKYAEWTGVSPDRLDNELTK